METNYAAQKAVARLKIRDSLLRPNSLASFDARMCGGGVGVLCAFARPEQKDFLIPLHVRSGKVADGRGLLSVVPKAAHQPGVGNIETEVEIYWTVLREVYEELFSGAAAERNPGRAKHDWYCDENEAVRSLRDGNFGSFIETTGFGIDTTSGNYFVTNLVVIPDPEFWDTFGS